MFDRDTELADFNTFIREYSNKIFFVAGRFYDLKPDDWLRYSCEWYQKHGWRELPNDRYIGTLPNGQEAIRYHSVDAMAMQELKTLTPMAQLLVDTWLARKTQLDRLRNEPDKKIEPPPPEPPKAKPIELPPQEPKPEKPKKENPNPNLVKFGVWFGIIGAAASAASLFFPAAKPFVVAIVAIVKGILQALGA